MALVNFEKSPNDKSLKSLVGEGNSPEHDEKVHNTHLLMKSTSFYSYDGTLLLKSNSYFTYDEHSDDIVVHRNFESQERGQRRHTRGNEFCKSPKLCTECLSFEKGKKNLSRENVEEEEVFCEKISLPPEHCSNSRFPRDQVSKNKIPPFRGENLYSCPNHSTRLRNSGDKIQLEIPPSRNKIVESSESDFPPLPHHLKTQSSSSHCTVGQDCAEEGTKGSGNSFSDRELNLKTLSDNFNNQYTSLESPQVPFRRFSSQSCDLSFSPEKRTPNRPYLPPSEQARPFVSSPTLPKILEKKDGTLFDENIPSIRRARSEGGLRTLALSRKKSNSISFFQEHISENGEETKHDELIAASMVFQDVSSADATSTCGPICAICQDTFPRDSIPFETNTAAFLVNEEEPYNENMVCQLACGHMFHGDELRQWFLRHLSAPTCPTCRTSVPRGNYDVIYRKRMQEANDRGDFLFSVNIPLMIWRSLVSGCHAFLSDLGTNHNRQGLDLTRALSDDAADHSASPPESPRTPRLMEDLVRDNYTPNRRIDGERMMMMAQDHQSQRSLEVVDDEALDVQLQSSLSIIGRPTSSSPDLLCTLEDNEEAGTETINHKYSTPHLSAMSEGVIPNLQCGKTDEESLNNNISVGLTQIRATQLTSEDLGSLNNRSTDQITATQNFLQTDGKFPISTGPSDQITATQLNNFLQTGWCPTGGNYFDSLEGCVNDTLRPKQWDDGTESVATTDFHSVSSEGNFSDFLNQVVDDICRD